MEDSKMQVIRPEVQALMRQNLVNECTAFAFSVGQCFIGLDDDFLMSSARKVSVRRGAAFSVQKVKKSSNALAAVGERP
jgi:hypothetical protein